MPSPPSKFHALVENDRGYVKVSLEYLGGIKKLRLSLEWLTDDRHFSQDLGVSVGEWSEAASGRIWLSLLRSGCRSVPTPTCLTRD